MRDRKIRKVFWDRRRRAVWWACIIPAAFFMILQPLEAAGKEAAEAEAEETRFADRTQRYPLLSELPGDDFGDYIALSVPGEEAYVVKKGDTLWGISRSFYGAGRFWKRIEEANPDAVGKEGLIFPGAELTVPQVFYVEKQAASQGGFSAPACSYDTPAYWTFGYTEWEVCLESVRDSDRKDGRVCTHITENRMFPDGVGEKWEEMQENIKASAGKTEGVRFSRPQFERYLREDGRELIFYSFICEAGEEKIQYAVAYVIGKKYLAEFIGDCRIEEQGGQVTSAYAIEEITRYMAASFAETEEEKNWASLKYRPYLGYENWAYEDLHNPFAMAAELYAQGEDPVYEGEDEEVVFVSREWEELLRNVTAYHFDMTDEEWEELSDRPLYKRDLAWITDVVMAESPIPGRDAIEINGLSPANAACADYNLTTLKDIAVLPNLESLELEIGTVSDYEVLAECPSLKEISIALGEPLRETGWLKELPRLEYLALRISMFPHLTGMGYRKDEATTFDPEKNGGGKEKDYTDKDLGEVLAECRKLKYLELESEEMEDFDFIGQLPDLYAFRLYGRDGDSAEGEARQSLFGEDAFPQVKCLAVDDKWLRNPE